MHWYVTKHAVMSKLHIRSQYIPIGIIYQPKEPKPKNHLLSKILSTEYNTQVDQSIDGSLYP